MSGGEQGQSASGPAVARRCSDTGTEPKENRQSGSVRRSMSEKAPSGTAYGAYRGHAENSDKTNDSSSVQANGMSPSVAPGDDDHATLGSPAPDGPSTANGKPEPPATTASTANSEC